MVAQLVIDRERLFVARAACDFGLVESALVLQSLGVAVARLPLPLLKQCFTSGLNQLAFADRDVGEQQRSPPLRPPLR